MAEHCGDDVGYTLYHDAFDTAYMASGYYVCDVFVVSDHRRRGIMRAMLRRLGQQLRSEGRNYICWVALAINAAVYKTYQALGATGDDGRAFALFGDRLDALIHGDA